MPDNRIKFVFFDHLSLPLPVSTMGYSAIEMEEEIIFIGNNSKPFTENFITHFNETEVGRIKDPSGAYDDYSLFIQGHQSGTDFSLTIHVIGSDKKEKSAIHFDPKAYLESFENAFMQAASEGLNPEPGIEFESAFSTSYLKNTLSPHIDGNDAFWLKFYRDLDVATAPMNLMIDRVRAGEEIKDIIVIDQDEAASFGLVVPKPQGFH